MLVRMVTVIRMIHFLVIMPVVLVTTLLLLNKLVLRLTTKPIQQMPGKRIPVYVVIAPVVSALCYSLWVLRVRVIK